MGDTLMSGGVKCSSCESIKQPSEFYRRTERFTILYRQPCKRCRKIKYQKMCTWVESFKNKPCMDCGGWFASCQMQFDHRNPLEKKFQISLLGGRSKISLYNEIKKCDVVCANCHCLRTQRRRYETMPKMPKIGKGFGAYRNRY